MVRRPMLVIACGALLSCHMILGMDDLDVESAPADAGGFDWDFDTGSPDELDGGDDVDATLPAADAGADAGDGGDDAGASKRVFVTSQTFSADFKDVAGAHAKCQAAADKAELGGQWVAWLSAKDTPAIAALAFGGPYELLDGTLVVTHTTALLEGLEAPIDVMEDGKKTTSSTHVWTGTRMSGDVGESCGNWTDKSLVKLGTMGSVDATDKGWTDNGGQPLVSSQGWTCNASGRLYCFEQ